MLSGIKPKMSIIIALHLTALFVVSLVCHGELRRAGRRHKHLTAFYLLMSLGGVFGGLFKRAVAPLVFNTLAEYPVALIVACLLLPALDLGKKSEVSTWLDVGSIVCLSLLASGLVFFSPLR